MARGRFASLPDGQRKSRVIHRETIPLVANETDAERKKMVAALRRLLITGKPRTVALDDRLVIDTLRREAGVTRAALTYRHIDLKKENRDLQTRATHWEGAGRDLARTVAALQMLYAKASARLDAIIADVAREDLEPEPGPNVSPISGRRRR